MSDAQIYDLYAQKISDITNIPYPYIIVLRDNGLLNQKEARFTRYLLMFFSPTSY